MLRIRQSGSARGVEMPGATRVSTQHQSDRKHDINGRQEPEELLCHDGMQIARSEVGNSDSMSPTNARLHVSSTRQYIDLTTAARNSLSRDIYE